MCEAHQARATAIRSAANQLTDELVGPFPTKLKNSAGAAAAYLRTYAADVLWMCEQNEKIAELAAEVARLRREIQLRA